MRPEGPTAHTSSAPKPYTSSVPCHSSSGTKLHAVPSKCHTPTQLAMYTSLADDPQTPAFPCPPVPVGVHTTSGGASACDGTAGGASTVSDAVALRGPLVAV